MTTIIEKVRNLISDILQTQGRDEFEYISSKIFTLTEANIVAASLIVYKNGSVWSAANYSYSSTIGKLTVTGTLVAGDDLAVTYSYYSKYSDTELIAFIKAAISKLSVETYTTFKVNGSNIIFPTPDESQENLIAVVAALLLKGDIRAYRTPEFTLTFNENESVDTKIKKIVRQFKKTYGVLDYIALDEKLVEDEEDE